MLRFYRGGVQVSTRNLGGTIPVSNGALRIGGNTVWSEWFQGLIDEVRVYNRALSAAEIAADRDNPVGGGGPPPPDTTAPSVAVTTPSGGSAVAGSVAVTADATDNLGVAGVQFQLDGANLGNEDTSAPYGVNWDTTAVAPGTHTLTAVARDAAGIVTTSPPVVVTVDNSAPTVSLTAPAPGATVTGLVDLAADAADNDALAGVQFRIDATNAGAEDAAAPYTISWNSGQVANGTHTVTAVAPRPRREHPYLGTCQRHRE